MTEDEKILWRKISSFNVDDDSSEFRFSARLARENGWKHSYATGVIEEYKKFIFLCCVTKTGVTPSDQVDQAWHLHLTYTKSYWTGLCKNTLSKEIHHNPTKGGYSEGKKFDSFYTDTLKLYEEKFKSPPPKHIWPDNETRFSDINFQRVNIKKFWLLRRPGFSRKNLTIVIVVFLSFLFIQSQYGEGVGLVIGLAFLLGLLFWNIFKNKGGGGNGCSNSGCGGDSGHSGCGGSGCSGCGGD